MRIEHEALVLREIDPLPVLIHVVDADLIDVDHPGITARAIADEPGWRRRRETDAQIQPLADGGLALDQSDIGMDFAQMTVAHATWSLVGVELLADPAQKPDLVETRSVADLDGEGARTDLGEERATIALFHRIEGILPVGDQPGEHVDAAD